MLSQSFSYNATQSCLPCVGLLFTPRGVAGGGDAAREGISVPLESLRN